MKKTIKLNNETFVVKKVKGELRPLEYRSLFDCYNRPSDIKQYIWNQWIDWSLQFDENATDLWLGALTVVSYNCRMISLGCNVYNRHYEFIGYLYITKTRQEFWTI